MAEMEEDMNTAEMEMKDDLLGNEARKVGTAKKMAERVEKSM